MVETRQVIDGKVGWIGECDVRAEDSLRSDDPAAVSCIETARESEGSRKVNGHGGPSVAPHVNGKDNRADLVQLARVIEGEIIPRLVLAHVCEPLLVADGQLEEELAEVKDIPHFARLLIEQSPAEAIGYVDGLRDRGLALETLLLDVMAPAARLLGDWWAADLCDFADVTIGLSRLQLMLRDLGPEFDGNTSNGTQARRALLAPMPGEQHTFGVFMVEEFLRRDGWEVSGGPIACNDELLSAVHDQHYSLVGLSVSHDRDLEPLASLIPSIRKCSSNRKVHIMVGGQVFIKNPGCAAGIGADSTATDGRSAVAEANKLFRSEEGSC